MLSEGLAYLGTPDARAKCKREEHYRATHESLHDILGDRTAELIEFIKDNEVELQGEHSSKETFQRHRRTSTKRPRCENGEKSP